MESSRNNPVPERIAPRQLPGIYMILCVYTNKRYYGLSSNISARLSQHKSRLRRNIHEIPELQRDWNLYGETNFQFSVVFISKDATKEELEALEMEHISRNHNICYNKWLPASRKKQDNPFWGQEHTQESRDQISRSLRESYQTNPQQGLGIQLKGKIYPSIAEAARQTTHSRDTIRRWLNDPNNPNCILIDENQKTSKAAADSEKTKAPPSNKNRPVRVDGVLYPSIGEAARQTGYSRTILQRRLKQQENQKENN